MIKVYISGQITGLSHDEYWANFGLAESVLNLEGMEPVNPLKVQACVDEKCSTTGETKPDGSYLHNYRCYMKYDTIALLNCDAILMLPNWRESRGAMFELGVASMCGIKVFYFNPHERRIIT